MPKKLGKPSGSKSCPKKVVLPPSGTTICGFSLVMFVGVPSISKRIGVPPAEE
ncbi:MAG TPA: hypothetical protein VJL89_07430 [Thermodesulfovibrionia bacterium]|nr:hypothetical protein [Thermodesulfovibrionia bacterium]